MTQPTHPRPPSAELKLIRKALRRLARHPDNKGALYVLNSIHFDIEQALGKNLQLSLKPDPATKDYARQRDFIET